MSMPRNAAKEPGLVCTLCGDGIFVGNGKACYVCMASSQRPKIGTDDHSYRANLVFLAEGLKRRLQRVCDKLAKTCGDSVGASDCEHLHGKPSINDRMQILLEQPTRLQLLDEIERADPAYLKLVRERLMKREVQARAYTPDPPPVMVHPATKAMFDEMHNRMDADAAAEVRKSVNIAIVHTNPDEAPTEVRRTGNESVCEVCGKTHIEHQLHQFGTGPLPLLLRKLCDTPKYTPNYVKL